MVQPINRPGPRALIRYLVDSHPGDLFICAKHLFVAAIEDGESVRVPMFLADGVDLSNHQPGYRSLNDAGVQDARKLARESRDR